MQAGNVKEAARLFAQNPGAIASAFGIESVPDILVGLAAMSVLGPVAGGAALTGTAGVQGYTGGLIGALSKEGVNVTDSAQLRAAFGNQELMDRVRKSATTDAAITAGITLAMSIAGTRGRKTRVSVAPTRNIKFYETFIEVPKNGATRKAHRASANRYLATKLKENPEFAAAFNRELKADVLGHMQSGKGLRNPPGMEWHHSADNLNVLHLLRKEEHRSPALRSLLHPDGIGGFGRDNVR
jgi:hypothetical protein